MTLRDRFFGVLLWWSVIGLGIWIGGTLYMMLVINPIWSASPASVEAFFGGTSFTDHILNFFGPLWILPRYAPLLIALIVGWRHKPHRYYLLAAVAVFVFVDLEKLRAESEKNLDPAWVAKYGEASWRAALVQLGLLPPNTPPDGPIDAGEKPRT